MRSSTAVLAACLSLAAPGVPLRAAAPNFPVPEVTPVEQDAGFNDEPSMARASDGSVYAVWNSFRDGADSLQIARYEVVGERFKSLATWQVLGGKGTYILAPKVVAAGEGVFVLYAAERDRNWEVFAVPCGSGGPGRPVNVSAHPGVDFKPAGAWRDGTLWVAWESNREGSRAHIASRARDHRRNIQLRPVHRCCVEQLGVCRLSQLPRAQLRCFPAATASRRRMAPGAEADPRRYH